MRAAWAALIVCGCGSDPVSLRLDVPVENEHHGMIVIVERPSGAIAHAFDVVDGVVMPTAFDFSIEHAVHVIALLYEQELASLDAKAGPINTGPRPVPMADSMHRLSIVDGAASAWAEEQTIPDIVGDFGLRIPPCPTFESNVHEVASEELTFVAGLDARWALAGTRSDAVYFVDSAGTVVRQDGVVPLRSAFVQPTGRTWVGGFDGKIYEVTLDLDAPSLTLGPPDDLGPSEEVIDLVGAPTGDERFALTTDGDWGGFYWWDGSDWEQPGPNRNTPHDATWVEPGYGLFASFFRDGQVYGMRDGDEIDIVVEGVAFGSVISIEHIPGLGLVAGTSGGEVHLRRDGGTWAAVPTSVTMGIEQILAYADGFAWRSVSTMSYWRDDEAQCDPLAVVGRELGTTTVVGDDLVTMLDRGEVVWFARN